MGLSEIEYIGNIVDRHGESFSQKKQNQVLDFRKPNSVKDRIDV